MTPISLSNAHTYNADSGLGLSETRNLPSTPSRARNPVNLALAACTTIALADGTVRPSNVPRTVYAKSNLSEQHWQLMNDSVATSVACRDTRPTDSRRFTGAHQATAGCIVCRKDNSSEQYARAEAASPYRVWGWRGRSPSPPSNPCQPTPPRRIPIAVVLREPPFPCYGSSARSSGTTVADEDVRSLREQPFHEPMGHDCRCRLSFA